MHETIIQLRAAEAKYRGIFENAIEGIYQSTPTGRYLAINSALAKMYGYENPEEMMDAVSDIQNQIYVDHAFRKRFMDEIESTGVVRALEYEVRRRDGSIIWISESARTVWETDGTVLYYEGFIVDITDRKHREAERGKLIEELQAALAEIKTLSGMVPVCGWCKSIRTDQGFWQSVEQFVHARTDATISHGICPSCIEKFGAEIPK